MVILLNDFDGLSFVVTGIPEPEVHLFVDQVQVTDENDHIKLIKNGNNYTVSFQQNHAKNAGLYHAKAFNLVGQAECSCRLNIQGNII